MAAHIRFQFAGTQLPVVIERLSDGAWWNGTAFVALPVLPVPIMLTPVVPGIVGLTLAATGWQDGNYGAYACDVDKAGAFVATDSRYTLGFFSLINGSDVPPPPAVLNLTLPAGTVANMHQV